MVIFLFRVAIDESLGKGGTILRAAALALHECGRRVQTGLDRAQTIAATGAAGRPVLNASTYFI